MNSNLTRDEIRKKFLEQRRIISTNESQSAGNRIVQRILQQFEGKFQSESILSYYPLVGEVDLRFLWTKFSSLFFPRTVGKEMKFFRANESTQFTKAKFGMEPVSEEEWAGGRGIVLVPGVAFHRLGHRLGFGQGYYDRFLAEHPLLYRIGIAHDFQISEVDWPVESHDQVMDAIYCPGGVWGSSRKVLESSTTILR